MLSAVVKKERRKKDKKKINVNIKKPRMKPSQFNKHLLLKDRQTEGLTLIAAQKI